MRKNTPCNLISHIIVMLFAFIMLTSSANAVDAPGSIVFEREGKLWIIQPDGAGEKVLSEKAATGYAVFSTDGDKVVFPYKHSIYMVDTFSMEEKLLYEGSENDKISIFCWSPKTDGFIFRKAQDNGSQDYYVFNLKENKAKRVMNLFENPIISTNGEYWAYTTLQPGQKSEESRIYVSEIGEDNRQFVFQGTIRNVLGWDQQASVVLYSMFDKIYAFDVKNRQRQIINLPLKNVFIVAYDSTGLLYHNLDQEERQSGILLYNPESGEEKPLIESKKTAYVVTQNNDSSKLVFFVPTRPGDDMGEGDLYLFEGRKGEAVKLTRDIGKRVLTKKNLDLQWSPDGKYFVYEQLRLRFSQIRRADLWIAGEGRNDRLKPHAANPSWGKDRREQ